MFRREPKRPRDVNQFAHQIVAESVGDAEKTPAPERTPSRGAGGHKGGPTRAEKLTPEERSAIARKAVSARWETGTLRFRRDRSEPKDDRDSDYSSLGN